MFRNFIRVAFRNLKSYREYSVINILGLAAGISVCLLIFLVIRFETSFDNFHRQKNNIYRVVSIFNTPAGTSYEPGVPFPTATSLRRDYPDLRNVASILSLGGDGQISPLTDINSTVTVQKFKENKGILYAEPQFFSMFDFEWLAGDKMTALTEPNTVVLARSIAEKYFGNWKNAMGKFIRLNNTYTFGITGVLKDPPANTDFPLRVVISYSTLKTIGFNNRFSDWVGIFAQHYCFVVLPENLTATQFNKELAQMVTKYKPAENRNEGMTLLPLKDMHFDTRYSTFNNHPFSKDLILALSFIGLFVLVIACANFINLATAQAINRSKEVGIRKVLGSRRSQLLIQFVSEAALLIVLSTAIAIGVTELSLPYINRLLGIDIDHQFFKDRVVIEALILILLGTTVLAGFYPAFVLSGFNPVTAFKSRAINKVSGAISLRRVLVVLQFTIAQALIIGVLIISSQMDYFRSRPMGFDKEAILITQIPGDKNGNSKIEYLRTKLKQMTGIKQVSFSFASPVDDNNWNSDITFNNIKKNDFGANLKWADADYAAMYKLKMVAGQFYGRGDTARDMVVNEAFVRKLGIHDLREVIGAKLDIPGEGQSGRILGIVKDFNIASLQDTVSPVIMGSWKATYQTVNIKIEPAKMAQVLVAIERLWNQSFPEQVYEYRFLDESIANYYKQEDQLSKLYKFFAGIAIFISCLGLYSLVSFMTVQRAKEVAIRKTLGASVRSIIYLFSREFTLLIIIAFCFSAPIAWYFMNQWLQNYAFHIEPGYGLFLAAVFISLLIAFLSVGYKSLKAALANPVNNLKRE